MSRARAPLDQAQRGRVDRMRAEIMERVAAGRRAGNSRGGPSARHDPANSTRRGADRNPFKVKDENHTFGKPAARIDGSAGGRQSRSTWDTARLRNFGDGIREVLSTAKQSDDGSVVLSAPLCKRLLGMSRSLGEAVLLAETGCETMIEFTPDQLEESVHLLDMDIQEEFLSQGITEFTLLSEMVPPDTRADPRSSAAGIFGSGGSLPDDGHTALHHLGVDNEISGSESGRHSDDESSVGSLGGDGARV